MKKILSIRRNQILILVVLIIFVFVYFIFLKPKNFTPKTVTSKVTKSVITVDVSATGNIIPTKIQNAGFRVGGKISEMNVKVGDTVQSYQQLARLDSTQIDDSIAQDQSNFNQANNNKGSKINTSPITKYDISNFSESINSAQAKLNIDQISLNNTQLTSPVSGTILNINNNIGDNVGGISSGSAQPFIILKNTTGSSTNVNFNSSGKLTEINVKVGDNVNTGQLLAKIDDTTYKNSVSQDQSSLNQANNNKNKALYNPSYTQYDIGNLNESINIAQIKLNMDKDTQNNYALRSNFSGVVAQINNQIGDTVAGTGSNSQNTSLAENASVIVIVDPASYEAVVTIGEADLPKIKVGQIVQLAFDALSSKTYTGSISSIDQLSTTVSNVVSYNIHISINKLDANIKSGMSVTASIIVQTKDNILTVPNAAIKVINGQKTIQIIHDPTHLQSTPENVTVTTGISDDTTTEIIDGLSDGDTIVTSSGNSVTVPSQTGGGLFNIGGGNRGGGGRAGGG